MKLGNTPQEQKGSCNTWHRVCSKKKKKEALFIYRSGDPVKKLVMISTIPPDTKPIHT